MPQPIHYSHVITVNFLPASLAERPDLAVHIAVISALWNEIEAQIAVFLASLLGTEGKTVMSVFVALQSDVAKRRAINSIVLLKLSAEDRAKFEKILTRVYERYFERNKVVHGSWGIGPDYPDKLLWSDVQNTNLLAVELIQLPGEENADARRDLILAMQKKVLVYGLKDFLDIEERLKLVSSELGAFCQPFLKRALHDHAYVPNPIPIPPAK
jgi:hypothetical protein